MKIYVIRHGLTPLNQQKKVNGEIDEPLALEGMEQAKAAILLFPRSVTHIYSSSLVRARQTAKIINSNFNLPISFHNELTEIHMGLLAGKSWENMENGLELKKRHRTVQFNYRPFGGESVGDVKERLIYFLKRLNGKHKDYETLIVTHGGVIRLLHFLEYGEAIYETEKHLKLLIIDTNKILKVH